MVALPDGSMRCQNRVQSGFANFCAHPLHFTGTLPGVLVFASGWVLKPAEVAPLQKAREIIFHIISGTPFREVASQSRFKA